MTLQVPPLRERLSDIPDLVDHFLQKTNFELGTSEKYRKAFSIA